MPPSSLVYFWGSNFNERLFDDPLTSAQEAIPNPSPLIISGHFSIGEISCGNNFIAFTTLQGHLFTMGSNKEGLLGIGSNDPGVFDKKTKAFQSFPVPTRVDSLLAHFVSHISCGNAHAMAIADSGKALFSWGSGSFGQTGQGTFGFSSEPKPALFALASGRQLAPDHPHSFKSISCGPFTSAVVTEEGQVFFCGDGMSGQLANGKNNRQNIATESPYISEKMQSVAVGESHILLLASNNSI